MRVSAILATALLFCGALGAQAAIYVKADAAGANNGLETAEDATKSMIGLAKIMDSIHALTEDLTNTIREDAADEAEE